MKRRSSVKSGELAHSHHELFEKRRPSVPATNSISYISTENVAQDYAIGESCAHHLHKHQRSPASSSTTGYRCEKHGGGRSSSSHHHSHAMLNGSSAADRRHRYHYDSHNVSSPSVAAAGYSDAGKIPLNRSFSSILSLPTRELKFACILYRIRRKCAEKFMLIIEITFHCSKIHNFLSLNQS